MQNALLFTLPFSSPFFFFYLIIWLLLAKLLAKFLGRVALIEIWGQSNKKEICGFNKVPEIYLL